MKRGKKRTVPKSEEENLDRFAGSSDEEEDEEEKLMAPPAPAATKLDEHHDADEENDTDEEEDDDEDNEFPPRDESLHNEETNEKAGNDEDDDDSSSIEGEEMDATTKMANAMSRILGTRMATSSKKSAPTLSVVLAKTVTPLQKLQQKEKEEQKAMKEKRQANRERNLTALHIPLSIATTNTIQPGVQLSVAKELEQERFHRRVATRGVVALFNAITQHQRTNNTDNDSNVSSKRKEISKLTKHGFLDKIKAVAKSKGGDDKNENPKREKNVADSEGNSRSSWGALKDDYMLNPKKNWDEESSDEEPESDTLESDGKVDTKGATSRKRHRVSGKR